MQFIGNDAGKQRWCQSGSVSPACECVSHGSPFRGVEAERIMPTAVHEGQACMVFGAKASTATARKDDGGKREMPEALGKEFPAPGCCGFQAIGVQSCWGIPTRPNAGVEKGKWAHGPRLSACFPCLFRPMLVHHGSSLFMISKDTSVPYLISYIPFFLIAILYISGAGIVDVHQIFHSRQN